MRILVPIAWIAILVTRLYTQEVGKNKFHYFRTVPVPASATDSKGYVPQILRTHVG